MKYTRISLLKSCFNRTDYEEIKTEIEANRNKIYQYNKNKNIPNFTVSYIPIRGLKETIALTVCSYKNFLFMGIYNENKNTITFNDSNNLEYIDKNEIDKLYLRYQNACKYQNTLPNPIKYAWLKTQPLLDKVIELEIQYTQYKSENNRYNEQNIPNNSFIRDKENLINKYICIYECLQELIQKSNIYYHDYDNLKIYTLSNNVALSLTDNPIYINQSIPEAERQSIKSIVDDYKLGLIGQTEQLTIELTEHGHVIRKNYEENDMVKIYIDKQITLVFYENNIDSIEKCIADLSEILEKDRITKKEISVPILNEMIERE